MQLFRDSTTLQENEYQCEINWSVTVNSQVKLEFQLQKFKIINGLNEVLFVEIY